MELFVNVNELENIVFGNPMCVRDESRVCRGMEARLKVGGGGRERLDHSEQTPMYENEQKRKGKHLIETTCLAKCFQMSGKVTHCSDQPCSTERPN